MAQRNAHLWPLAPRQDCASNAALGRALPGPLARINRRQTPLRARESEGAQRNAHLWLAPQQSAAMKPPCGAHLPGRRLGQETPIARRLLG
eukprot:8501493-Pyramimonas_sp.AAC.1